MNRAATSIVGGLMGLATGMLVTNPVTAFLGSTSVTWNTASCPAGIYTITAIARGDRNPQSYTVTTKNVSLPKATVTQDFQDLPPGLYWVTANATGNNGKSFQSPSLAITVGGDSNSTGRSGRNRPPANNPIGFARPRNVPAPPREPRLTPPTDSPSGSAVAGSMGALFGDAALDLLFRRILVQLDDASAAADQFWRRIEAIDTDADGVIDVIAIESVTGEIRVYRIVR